MGLKLHLGCGNKLLPEPWVNVDQVQPLSIPDGARFDLLNLESYAAWPYKDNTFDEAQAIHVLEHIGDTYSAFVRFLTELYRVCAHNAVINIAVPHPRHDHFLGDPSHVRPITPAVFAAFSKRLNHEWIAAGYSNSTLGLVHNLDFDLVEVREVLDPEWVARLQNGSIGDGQLAFAKRFYNNVIMEYQITLKVLK